MEELSKKRIIISGATACGKSSLAIKLAKELNGEVVNIDSVQVFKEYNIGSAKPDLEFQSKVKHHLIDIVSPADDLNVYDYNLLLKKKLIEIDNNNKIPLIVGGSTLYIKTFLEGISRIENKDEIKLLREKLEKENKETLYEELQNLDMEAANNINKNDKFRIIRALELVKTFKSPLSKILKDNLEETKKNQALIFVLCRNRAELHKRINQRCEIMIKDGLINEARSLLSKYGSKPKIFKTLGLKEALMYLKNELDDNELFLELSKNTRRYAKRQMTFWRNEPAKNNWLIYSSKSCETVNFENITVNKLKLTQVVDLINVYFADSDLSTKVVYLDVAYLK